MALVLARLIPEQRFISACQHIFDEVCMTQAELLTLFHYDPATGIFTNRTDRVRARAGKVAGCRQKNGYLSVGFNKKKYDLHRLAWLYAYGCWPDGMVDHIDGVKHNNALNNLREATQSENAQNVAIKSRLQGIRRVGNRWKASLMLGKQHVNLGTHATPEQAHEAYLVGKKKLHPRAPI